MPLYTLGNKFKKNKKKKNKKKTQNLFKFE